MSSSPTDKIDGLAKFCRELAELGGENIRQFDGQMGVRSKGKRDWVTAVDEQTQAVIARAIAKRFPDSILLGEEASLEEDLGRMPAAEFSIRQFADSLGQVPELTGPLVWIVDPIDGTNNFIHGFPYYAVSVAVAVGGTVVAGAVLDVCRAECYWASAESGAFCNSEPLQISTCRELSQAMVVGSIPRLHENYPNCHEIFRQVSDQCQSVRRLGSAALNLAYLAAGKLDSYWALSLQIWDIAAGALILQQAGGVQNLEADPASNGFRYLGSCNDRLHHQMAELVSQNR